MKKRILILFLSVLGLLPAAEGKAINVILTTDCGTDIDDQWAIVYLLVSPEFDVKGIVTTHAPNLTEPRAENSAKSVRDVLQRLGAKSPPPVFAGSSIPLQERKPLVNQGVNFILRISQGYSRNNRLIILTTGAATDVASAFLVDPTLGERVKIITMGFESWPHGGDSWNIRNDALAYKIILESSAPITVGDAAVCRTHLNLDAETAKAMVGGHGEVGSWLAELLREFITKYDAMASHAVGPHQWAIWDDIVIADMLGFTETQVYPRPDLNARDFTFVPLQTDRTINWITQMDQRRMWMDFVTKLDKHNSTLRQSH